LKSFGLVLVLIGLGLIPAMLLAIEIFHLYVSNQDFHMVLIVLLALADASLIAGVLIRIPRRRNRSAAQTVELNNHLGNR
jgi:hypothetical protein